MMRWEGKKCNSFIKIKVTGIKEFNPSDNKFLIHLLNSSEHPPL